MVKEKVVCSSHIMGFCPFDSVVFGLCVKISTPAIISVFILAPPHRGMSTPQKEDGPVPTLCKGCGKSFPSKSAVFRHLTDTLAVCLPEEARIDFVEHHLRGHREKVVLLYSYWISGDSQVQNGDDVASLLLDVLERFALIQEGRPASALPSTRKVADRSYGSLTRQSNVAAQDEGTSAITELLTTKLPPLSASETGLSAWQSSINQQLDERCRGSGDIVRVLGRQKMPLKRFSAESDMTFRRVEYLIPADFLFPETHSTFGSFDDFCASFPTLSRSITSRRAHDLHHEKNGVVRMQEYPDEVMTFFRSCKKTMRLLSTHIEVVKASAQNDAKKASKQRRRENDRTKRRKKQELPAVPTENKATRNGNTKEKPLNIVAQRTSANASCIMKRRRYHNFTPSLMAHDTLSLRRLDRFNHLATLRFEALGNRPFFSLSLSGDVFLHGQPCRVIGLFVALMQGVVDPEIVECVFDEAYPHLVPTPPVPSFGLYASEALYSAAEGKAKLVLSPRFIDGGATGSWTDESTLDSVESMQDVIRENVARKWAKAGADCNGRLNAEKRWRQEVLLPWAEKTRLQLEDYRSWKRAKGAGKNLMDRVISASVPAPLNETVPGCFQRVLSLLQDIDQQGRWPTTTPKRQLVMVATDKEKTGAEFPLGSTSLLIACRKANSNKKEIVPSPYSYQEGEGGASGSFSVGFMPGDDAGQPKMNALFPELTKAAFELEKSLCPDRISSSTIAINRNAQFRPHTDSGAGVGQGTSLIVGLGSYEGGELVVEGEKVDIRYKPLEFDGWKQRHWTMPFTGERYSLVWFTPKGCEGKLGIHL